jgi:hypothetical protein
VRRLFLRSVLIVAGLLLSVSFSQKGAAAFVATATSRKVSILANNPIKEIYYYRGRYYPYRYHGHYYRHRNYRHGRWYYY